MSEGIFSIVSLLIGYYLNWFIELSKTKRQSEEKKSEKEKMYYQEIYNDSRVLLLDYIVKSSELEKSLYEARSKKEKKESINWIQINEELLLANKALNLIQLIISDLKLAKLATSHYSMLFGLYNLIAYTESTEYDSGPTLKKFSEFQISTREYLEGIRKKSYGVY